MFSLRDVIHELPGVGKGHHVQFILPVGVNASPWLLARRRIYYANCTWYFIYLWGIVELWISVSIYNLLYPCDYLGTNIWRPCTCILIWCWRWRCLYEVPSWLSLMWMCWLLLGSIRDSLPQWFFSVSFLFLWSYVTYFSHIGRFYIFWFVFMEDKIYCASSCICFPHLWRSDHFIAHRVFPYWFVYFC